MTLSPAQAESRNLSPEQTVAVKNELTAILASDSFSSSNRCRDFLEFVVNRALAGDYESLTERFIGVEVFGRAIDYETATDSIVRVRANDVRRRLAQYYSGQHPAKPVKIDLIAGGYIPEFHWKTKEKVDPSSGFGSSVPNTSFSAPLTLDPHHLTPGSESERSHVANDHRRTRIFVWGCTMIAAAVAALLALNFARPPDNFDRFWSPVLKASSVPVLVLPTTDTLQLQPGVMKLYGQLKPGGSMTLGWGDVLDFHNWHTSLPVLQATLSVALALQRKGQVPLVRMGTDLKRDELRGHPIIAIGSFSNPWTQENVSGLRFTFDRGASDNESPRIRDARNPNRSWSLASIYPEPQKKDYAIVTRTFDPVTREPFLSLAGLHSFGNQIAGEFVSQESSWNEVARRAPAGWENMNLQIVLEADIIGTTPSSPRIVDVHFWK